MATECKQTTEQLFEDLSPQAREEAVRIANRLKEQSAESALVVAAAREAGIDDQHLRAAVETLRKTSSPAVYPAAPVAALVTLLYLFAQCRIGALLFTESSTNLWIPFGLAAVLGALFPRSKNRVLAPLVVMATWAGVALFYSLVSQSSAETIEMARTYAVRIAVVQATLAFFGALIANGLGSLLEKERSRRESAI